VHGALSERVPGRRGAWHSEHQARHPVQLLPLYHPLRFIEEVCMLDNLSQGRLQIGLGRGITAIEHTYWGLQPEDAQRRYAESLAIIVQGLTGDT
jgi:alkanesulfonate monooxygenase SsuD/methylene tetrahydromethanopterin reductase-like flavin-dependent oxidoreductase (luciferase family)